MHCSLPSFIIMFLQYSSNSVNDRRRMPKVSVKVCGHRFNSYQLKRCLVGLQVAEPDSLLLQGCSCLHVGRLKIYCTLRAPQAQPGEGGGVAGGRGRDVVSRQYPPVPRLPVEDTTAIGHRCGAHLHMLCSLFLLLSVKIESSFSNNSSKTVFSRIDGV